MLWESIRNVMGKVIKIITLNTFQMVTVRIYDPPYCTLKVMFFLVRRRNMYCWLLWLPVYWLGELDFKKIKGENKEKTKINTAIKVHCCIIQL